MQVGSSFKGGGDICAVVMLVEWGNKGKIGDLVQERRGESFQVLPPPLYFLTCASAHFPCRPPPPWPPSPQFLYLPTTLLRSLSLSSAVCLSPPGSVCLLRLLEKC